MRLFVIGFILILNFIRCFPHLVIFLFHKNRKLIEADITRWLEIKSLKYGQTIGFIYLLSFFREFRNVYYHRIGKSHHILNLFCPKLSTLYIKTRDIGAGLYISHGFSTGISAKSIGKNCYIGHQVSIGYYQGFPTIMDNVTIYAGAVVIGNITIGNNSIIGVNTTVFRNVPDNCTVIPDSSRIIKWKMRSTQINFGNEIDEG
jgi:serine O-acetyltransferase